MRLTKILAAASVVLATWSSGHLHAQSEPTPDSPDDNSGQPGDDPATVPAGEGEGLENSGGIGIAPAFITLDETLRGNDYTTTIILVNGLTGDRDFALTPDGEIADWITFVDPNGEAIDSIVVPHQETAQLQVVISIPGDTANGRYTGDVDIAGTLVGTDAEASAGTSSADVSFGALVPIAIDVGGEMRQAATFDDLRVSGAEVGQPIEFAAAFNNTGNVAFDPTVVLTIMRNGQLVEVLTSDAEQTVAPGRAQDVVVLWDTTDTLPGDYTVEAAPNAPGYEFEAIAVPFRIEAPGSVERTGTLRSLELVNQALPGSLARIRGVFVNTSPVPVSATLVAEVTRDGVLVGEVRSLELLVRPNRPSDIDVSVEELVAGDYEIVGKVNFEGRETESLTTSFTVTPAGATGADAMPADVPAPDDGGSSTAILALAAGGGALAAVVLFLLLRRRRGPAGDAPRPTPISTPDAPASDAREPSREPVAAGWSRGDDEGSR